MRKAVVLTTLVLAIVFMGTSVQAALINNGSGLIYDTSQNITLYDYNPGTMTWPDAMAWALGLKVGGVTGWGLPTTPGTDYGFTSQGQLGKLYYVELGNVADATGIFPKNLAPFQSLQTEVYWTSYPPFEVALSLNAVGFSFRKGTQGLVDPGDQLYVLAVHPGDIGASVPIPGAILLFAPGLAGLAMLRRRIRR